VLGVHRVELEVLAFNRRAINCYLPAGSAGKASVGKRSCTPTAGKT
jgi:hypothetical protein